MLILCSLTLFKAINLLFSNFVYCLVLLIIEKNIHNRGDDNFPVGSDVLWAGYYTVRHIIVKCLITVLFDVNRRNFVLDVFQPQPVII